MAVNKYNLTSVSDTLSGARHVSTLAARKNFVFPSDVPNHYPLVVLACSLHTRKNSEP